MRACFPCGVVILVQDPLREIAALELLSDPGHANVLRRVEAIDDGE